MIVDKSKATVIANVLHILSQGIEKSRVKSETPDPDIE